MDDPLLPILVLIILIFVNAFFAAAEIAVISLSESKLKKQAEENGLIFNVKENSSWKK